MKLTKYSEIPELNLKAKVKIHNMPMLAINKLSLRINMAGAEKIIGKNKPNNISIAFYFDEDKIYILQEDKELDFVLKNYKRATYYILNHRKICSHINQIFQAKSIRFSIEDQVNGYHLLKVIDSKPYGYER